MSLATRPSEACDVPRGTLNVHWSLDALEAQVYLAIRGRRGRAQAISARELAREVGIEGDCTRRASPRAVQTIVSRLREQHGLGIASTAGRPPGYFWPASAAELERCYIEHRKKALSTLRVMAALRRTTLPALLGQLALELAESEPSRLCVSA